MSFLGKFNLLLDPVTCKNVNKTYAKETYCHVEGYDAPLQQLLDWLLFELFLLVLELFHAELELLKVLFVPSKIVLCLNRQFFLDQVC